MIGKRKNQLKREVIGILSTEPGCGCTHFSIMLANYLSNVKGYKVCIGECNESRAFERLEQTYEGNKDIDSRTTSFRIFKVKYFKDIKVEEMPDLLNESYDYMVVDFGSDYNGKKEEFKRCQRKFIIGSLCDWKLSSYIRFLQETRKEFGRENWEFISISGDNVIRKELEKRYKKYIHPVPFEDSPFFISNKNLPFFKRIL